MSNTNINNNSVGTINTFNTISTGVSMPTISISNIGSINTSSSWGNSNNTFFNQSGYKVLNIPAEGKSLEVNGRLKLNGEYIDERLKRIEDILHIPQRDIIMEQKYKRLREIWAEYNDVLAALNTWETIKESE